MGGAASTPSQPATTLTPPAKKGILDTIGDAASSAVTATKNAAASATQSVKDAVGVPSVENQATSLGAAPEGGNPMLGGRRRRRGRKSTKGGRRSGRKTRKH
jgi:hypothetical protein